MTNLWIEGMKALLRHIKGITSGTHSAPEKIWLPFRASKGCQGTIHYMSLQDHDIVQLHRSPTWTGCSSLICFVGKNQLILQVLPNPLCQLCGQPAQGRVGRPVHILQPRWRGFFPVWHSQGPRWIMQELNPARFEKVEVKAYTTSGNRPVCMCQLSKDTELTAGTGSYA